MLHRDLQQDILAYQQYHCVQQVDAAEADKNAMLLSVEKVEANGTLKLFEQVQEPPELLLFT